MEDDGYDRKTCSDGQVHEALLEREELSVSTPSAFWPHPEAHIILFNDLSRAGHGVQGTIAVASVDEEVPGELVGLAEERYPGDFFFCDPATAEGAEPHPDPHVDGRGVITDE